MTVALFEMTSGLFMVCLWFGLSGLGEKGAPQEDGGPEVKRHDAERLRERQRELRQRESVGEGEGEESEG